jgi:hypothetical protein
MPVLKRWPLSLNPNAWLWQLEHDWVLSPERIGS